MVGLKVCIKWECASSGELRYFSEPQFWDPCQKALQLQLVYLINEIVVYRKNVQMMEFVLFLVELHSVARGYATPQLYHGTAYPTQPITLLSPTSQTTHDSPRRIPVIPYGYI